MLDAQVLLALLRARSFSGAGVRLGVNASTVSRRLDALEAALGVHLFDRTPDGVLPTAAAEELGPHAEAMERAAAGLALAAQGREALPEGEVRLTAPPGVAEFLIAPALPRLLGTQLAAAAAGVGVLLVDPHTAKVCGLVEVPLAAALRRTLPALHGGALWLVVHRALRDTLRDVGDPPRFPAPSPGRTPRRSGACRRCGRDSNLTGPLQPDGSA
jgi:DNA-binding transcriptional LysR family regulator